MINSVNICEFVQLAEKYPVIDVRSPSEFEHGCIPGARSLPLFTDEERKIVGTLYKKAGRQDAIKTGLEYFGTRMRDMVEKTEAILNDNNSSDKTVIVHCWRGGMRSAGVAWLLDLYGFKVHTLQGGYKSFRNWVLDQFKQSYSLKIIGGLTGAGKTITLKEMFRSGQRIIDLEGLACHKGSAFGALGEIGQPSQEMFENKLALVLYHLITDNSSEPIWVEDESLRIGQVNIPNPFWASMNRSPLYFLDIPFKERLDHIMAVYGEFKKEDLIGATRRIQKRLGGLNTKNTIDFLLEDNYRSAFSILLKYYDKCYQKGLVTRNRVNYTIAAAGVNETANCRLLCEQK